MEVSVPLKNPLSRSQDSNGETRSKIKSFLGFNSYRSTSLSLQSSLWRRDHALAGVSQRITATADFSRRRQRRVSSPRNQGSSPKGFTPRPQQVGTSIQKKDQKNKSDKEGPGNLPPKEFSGASKNVIEGKQHEIVDDVYQMNENEEEVQIEHENVVEEKSSYIEPVSIGTITQWIENGRISPLESKDTREVLKSDIDISLGNRISSETFQLNAVDLVELEQKDSTIVDNSLEMTTSRIDTVVSTNKNLSKEKKTDPSDEVKQHNITKIHQSINEGNYTVSPKEGIDIRGMSEDQSLNSKLDKKDDTIVKQKEANQLNLETEEDFHKRAVERLAEENSSKGNKLFYYPEVVKPDQVIKVFLDRSLSTLTNEPDVILMGAFNDWKWKSFRTKLNKTHLSGDWWSCQVHIPREAYKMDFVFFNGEDVYDNNDNRDFSIAVEGGMSVLEFEDFLLEEKHRELERLAKEQAEKERLEEQQRRIEAEKAAKEADRAQAKEEVLKRREMLNKLIKKAVKSADNVWYIEPSEFRGKDKVKLFYNRSSGPLIHANDLWLHGGHNNWEDGLSIVTKLARDDGVNGDWWYAEVVIPDDSLILDWVFADGPPQYAKIYDNNGLRDFHAIVPQGVPDEHYWIEEELQIYQRLQEERRLREEAIRAKAKKTAQLKAETKERTLKSFLLSQKHIVYTEPLDIQAGNSVTVFYNPANTVLNGKPEVWFRCSFNRWTHHMGTLPPQKMLPTENGSHVKATVKVPLDAYMLDFVFSERKDGGIFDNKNGMDYHIPISGGVTKEPPLHIVHVAVEMAPIAKVGGLGDVVTSLSRAVQDLNHNVDIILPKYDCLKINHVKDLQYKNSYSWGGSEIKVWHGKVEGLSVYFLEPQNGHFWAGCIYGRGNDGERFGFFCHAALEFLLQSGFHPDIIHCHDWSSAPVAWLFKDHYAHYGLSKARIVFTIHNLEFGEALIGKAMAFADKATTVSPTYSREVSGNRAIAPYLYKFYGILNGIDPDIWDPYNDKFIPVSYTSENVVEGKRAAKEALQQRLGLKKAELPLVGIISRLTHQKGIHLIKHAIWKILGHNGQVVLLGSAPDPRIQNDFVNLANELHSSCNDRARLCLTYDEPLSHLIYAGADFILVPSIFEPCGLTQLTAMRYGSIPVVRKTGGLYDTVFDVDHDKERAEANGLEPNGFNFDGADAAGVDYALNRAISAWYNGREWLNSLCKRVMEQDWSWNRPALDYLELYHAARK